MLYVAIWYVSIRPVVMRVKEELRSSYNTLAAGRNEQYVNYHLPNPLMQLGRS
jgi:hypothetical protein